ncbi:MAG: hypothetical protein M1827_002085 [Pycnora praestabilis]|nr:MAG: hypothetical protein M1827_002085 [Pycnora praestabilis]
MQVKFLTRSFFKSSYEDRDRRPTTETYRPGRSPSPRSDNFRSNRSPRPRPRSPPAVDTYIPSSSNRTGGRPRSRSPGSFRRRSRSPTFRGRDTGGSWRGRQRSPQRGWSPRREPVRRGDRATSPYGGTDGRSPRNARPRSPPNLKRSREVSPAGSRAMRSPPFTKRERLPSPPRERYVRPQSPPARRAYSPAHETRRSPPAGPKGSWRPRSRSPLRRDPHQDAHPIGSWRRRSQSPLPRGVQSGEASGRESTSTSRRSSPPIHPSRAAVQQSSDPGSRSKTWGGVPSRASAHPDPIPRSPPRSPYRARSPRRDRERSPPRRAYSPRPRSPPRGPAGYRSPPRRHDPPSTRESDSMRNGTTPATWSSTQIQDSEAGPSRRNGDSIAPRVPPSGPSGSGSRSHPSSAAMSPPSGPSAAPMSMSAHNRPANSVLTAPTKPRGGGYSGSSYSWESTRENSYHGPPSAGPRRAPSFSRHQSSYPSRGPPAASSESPRTTNVSPGGIPTGPRSSSQSSGPPQSYPSNPPYRPSHNSSSTTYPRSQRFASHHLSSLPSILPDGELLPSGIDPKVSERLAKLEEEKKKIEAVLAEKLEQKRAGLRTWERLERESARESLKSELAEQQMKKMTGEEYGSAAF